MTRMDETTKAADSGVTDTLTTPEEWRGFLERYDERYMKNEASDQELADLLDEDEWDLLEEEGRLERWLGEAPSPEEELAAAEERLGARFPPSLRGFFLASNGWKRVKGWVDLVRPCGEVTWMRDSDAGSSVMRIYGEEPANDDYVQVFRRCIEVAGGEDFWLLDPTAVGPDGEWTAYLFAPKYGDLQEFSSFSALFHDGYEDMD
ncbi:SMI1/KNR4 family protein [Streptomyces microflavus]|uniref:SMI1/KNR4 family protein n=1 Tax=Streptomyces microflavus TaxID=1919 RepID=UPI00225A0EF3|nr:SMI1/KNR4 family protein [Streptomyces microflavus]MCX4654307.1 SMI1/KNR4 family protein [Streptomyces microflavus]